MKIGLISLGCPKNLVDSEVMLGILQKEGFTITTDETEAEVLVINTCAFIDAAKEESINTILELAHLKEKNSCQAILVTGCLAQRYHRELAAEIPEIDGLLGTGAIGQIAAVVKDLLAGKKIVNIGPPGYLPTAATPRLRSTPKYTAYLKIAEGCNNRCTYCVIPSIRGPFKSRPIADVVREGAALAATGAKELILIAQDTTFYGNDLYGKLVLPDLLKQLAAIDGVYWIRLLYTYPSLISDELIDLMSVEKKICRYLDLPLQHASDRILSRMNRRGNNSQVLKLMEKIRAAIPGVTLRTTFITGFPGETEDDFLELLDFMRKIKFDRVGVFAYSQEEHTAAALMPGQIADSLKTERQDRAMALQQEISLEKNKQKIGKIIPVMMEGPHMGRSEGDAPDIDGKVYVNTDTDLEPGEFVRVLITGAAKYDLTGELVE